MFIYGMVLRCAVTLKPDVGLYHTADLTIMHNYKSLINHILKPSNSLRILYFFETNWYTKNLFWLLLAHMNRSLK